LTGGDLRAYNSCDIRGALCHRRAVTDETVGAFMMSHSLQ